MCVKTKRLFLAQFLSLVKGDRIKIQCLKVRFTQYAYVALYVKYLYLTGALAVVGHNSSDATLAAAPVYQQGGLVMISPTSFANNLSGFGNFIFRTVPTVRFMANSLAHYAVKQAKKTTIIACYDSQAQDNLSFKDEFVASVIAMGGKLTPTVCDFSSPTFDEETAIAQAINSGADGLLLAPHVDRIEKAIALARANQSRLALFASPTMYTLKTVQSGWNDVNGLVLPAPWDPITFANSPFPIAAHQKWGGEVNWRTATAYDATRAIVSGLQQSPTREGLQRALQNSNFSTPGASQDIKFSSTGDRIGQPILLQVNVNSPKHSFIPVNR